MTLKIPKHVVFLNKVLNRCNLNYDDWQTKTCYTSLQRNVDFTSCAITAKFLISKGYRVILTSGKLNTFINERHSWLQPNCITQCSQHRCNSTTQPDLPESGRWVEKQWRPLSVVYFFLPPFHFLLLLTQFISRSLACNSQIMSLIA